MTEFYDGSTAFLEASRAAEEAALGGSLDGALADTPETPEPQQADTPAVENTVEAEPAADDRPRNEKGQFVAKEEPTAVEQEQADRLLAGKYKSVEDLERAYTEAQNLIARQGNEVGELRRAFEDRFAQLEAQQRHVRITPDMINEDPARAVEIAWEQQDEHTLRRAFELWRDEDPYGAAAWATSKQAEQREAVLRAELEQVKQQVAQVQTPVQQQADTQTWREAWALAEQNDPKIRDVANVILEDVAPAYAHVFAPALAGDAKTRADALVALAQIARGRNAQNADTLNEAVVEAVSETAREAAQARSDAAVVSQDTAGGPTELTWEQREQERMKDMIARQNNNWWSTRPA